MRRVNAVGRVVCAGVLAACGLAALGPVATAQARQRGAGAEPAEVFDLHFAGGELGEFFDAVSELSGANIVAPAEVQSLRMPEAHLRGVSAWSAMQTVGRLFERTPEGVLVVDDVLPGDSAPVYVVRLMRESPTGEGPVVHEVFSVADVLRPANEEAVEPQVRKVFEMIESAMSLAPGQEKPELAYHDDTQMLVFRGTPEQRRLIESVLARYDGSWRPQSARAEALRHEIGEVELRAQEAVIEAEAAQTRLEFARERLEDTRALAQAGGISAGELQEATARAADLEAQVRLMRLRAEHAQRRLVELREALGAVTPGQGPSLVVYEFRDLGARGERIGMAFKALLDAAELPGTSLEADGSGMVTLRAGPALQEALRFLIGAVRERASSERGGAGR